MRFIHHTNSHLKGVLALCLISTSLSGCATLGQATDEAGAASNVRMLERPTDVRERLSRESASADGSVAEAQGLLDTIQEDTDDGVPPKFPDRSQLSRIPRLADGIRAGQNIDKNQAPRPTNQMIDARIPALPVPAFIEVAFGEYLGVPYTTGQAVAEKTNIVQLRTAGEMKADTFLELVTMALQDYGVRVTAQNGVYQILEDQALKARTPQFIKSRAKSSTPSNLRPVVQFVELNAIDANDMAGILRQALGRNQDAIKIDAASDSNFVILAGLPSDIETALDIIYQMDELDYAGTQVQRFSPAFWNAKELQQELRTIMEAEGWQTSVSAGLPKTILMLAVEYSNDLMIFTRTSAARSRVNYWLNELDQPTPQGDISQIFVYDVQNLDAQLLAGTVNQVLSSQSSPADAVDRPSNILSGQGIGAGGSFGTQGATAAGGPRQQDTNALPSNVRLVVDPLGNRLIYSGTASDYQRLLPLLRQLDRAPAEVLIEVTIADISLTDGLNYGVDWQINNIGDPLTTFTNEQGVEVTDRRGDLFTGGVGDIISGSGGVTALIANDNFQATLQAGASNGDVRILSTPRIFARSGGTAQIQVGTDVPVITSQSAANVELGDGILNLQSVAYRSTGILLSVEPVVFGNNRIDLNISQELSNTTAGTTAGVASPTFTNTSVSTGLSLEDGQTAVIAGLIQETLDQSNNGIPFLKDIPGIGNLFSSTSQDTNKREIVIFITAYVLQGQKDKNEFLNEFMDSFNETTRNSNLITLRPRRF